MNLNVKKTIQYWLESAEYDFDTAKSLVEAKRFPHALFFSHLALEKLLKVEEMQEVYQWLRERL